MRTAPQSGSLLALISSEKCDSTPPDPSGQRGASPAPGEHRAPPSGLARGSPRDWAPLDASSRFPASSALLLPAVALEVLPSRRLLPAALRTPRSVSLVGVGGAAPVRAEPSESRSFLGPFKLVVLAIWGSHDNNGGWGTRAGSGRSACAVRGRRSTSSRVAGAAVAGSLNRGEGGVGRSRAWGAGYGVP